MAKNNKKFRSNSLSRKRIFLASLLMVVIVYTVISLLISALSIGSPYDVKTIAYDFSVKDVYGFNVDIDGLHFGGGPIGSELNRGIILSANRPSRVVIIWDGPGNLSVDTNNFFIDPGVNKSVFFRLIIPADLPAGNYSGNVFVQLFES